MGIQILYALIYIALAWLVLYLFQKYVTPIDQKIVGIVIFILAIYLIIMILTKHSIMPW